MDDARGAALTVGKICQTTPITMWTSEADVQEALHDWLAVYYPVMREQRISDRDRPDFLIPTDAGNIAVEVKIQGSGSQILRQLGRYAQSEQVQALVFVSTRRVLLSGIPLAIHGKPIAVALIGGVGSII